MTGQVWVLEVNQTLLGKVDDLVGSTDLTTFINHPNLENDVAEYTVSFIGTTIYAWQKTFGQVLQWTDAQYAAYLVEREGMDPTAVPAIEYYFLEPVAEDGSPPTVYEDSIRAVPDTFEVDDSAATWELDLISNDLFYGNSAFDRLTFEQPQHGSLSAGDAGTVIYTPADGYAGSDIFQYTIYGKNGEVSTIFSTVLVTNSSNNAPIARDDYFEIPAGTASTFFVWDNDEDPDEGDNIYVSNVVPAPDVVVTPNPDGSISLLDGVVLLNDNGSITFRPDDGFTGETSFVYEIEDDLGATAFATVYLDVVSDGAGPPTAVDDTVEAAVNAEKRITVLSNDSAAGGATIVSVAYASGIDAAEYGTVVVNSDNSITYTPDADSIGIVEVGAPYLAVDTFEYTITDSNGESDSATVTVNLTNPISEAIDDTVNEYILPPYWFNLLDNDVLATGADWTDSLTISGVFGGVVYKPDTAPQEYQNLGLQLGDVIFVPDEERTGNVGFSYSITDTLGTTVSADAVFTIPQENRAPIAGDGFKTVVFVPEADGPPYDFVEVDPNRLLVVDRVEDNTDDIADFATDPDGDTLEVVAVSTGAWGNPVISQSNSFGDIRFFPAIDGDTGFPFSREGHFFYKVADPDGLFDWGKVTVRVLFQDNNGDGVEDMAPTEPAADIDTPVEVDQFIGDDLARLGEMNDRGYSVFDLDGQLLPLGYDSPTYDVAANGSWVIPQPVFEDPGYLHPTSQNSGQSLFELQTVVGDSLASGALVLMQSDLTDASAGTLGSILPDGAAALSLHTTLSDRFGGLSAMLYAWAPTNLNDANSLIDSVETMLEQNRSRTETLGGDTAAQIQGLVDDISLSVSVFNDTSFKATAVNAYSGGLGGGGDDSERVILSEKRDYYDGRGGHDLIIGLGGDDDLFGGSGNDLLIGGAGIDGLSGDAGNDTLIGGADNDFMFGGTDADDLNGGEGSDTLWGEDGNDTLHGGAEADRLGGGKNQDVLFGGLGADTLEGGEDNDIIFVDGAEALVDGGAGVDRVRIELVVGATINIVNWVDVERLDGTSGADVFSASGVNQGLQMLGFGGDDRIFGSIYADQLYGGDDNDSLAGGLGNDVLSGGAGIDTLLGQSGSDIIFAQALDVVDGGGGQDIIRFEDTGPVSHVVDATKWTNIERFDGGSLGDMIDVGTLSRGVSLVGKLGGDTLKGSEFNDVIFGNEQNDHLIGRSGADALVGGVGADTMEGGDGSDTFFLDGSFDVAIGGEGLDRARAEAGVIGATFDLTGWSGVERIRGTIGDDTITAATQTEDIVLNGDIGEDLLVGGFGNDMIFGADGTDVLFGGDGNDVFFGGEGNDQHYGEAGEDLFFIEGDFETVDGGAGEDRVVLTGTNQFVILDEWDSIERVDAAAGGSTIYADAYFTPILVVGKDGADDLSGSREGDRIFGNGGADFIYGNDGNDTLSGGLNDGYEDTFYFFDFSGVDTIVDFEDDIDKLSVYGIADVNSYFDLSISDYGDYTEIQAGWETIILENFNGVLDEFDFV